MTSHSSSECSHCGNFAAKDIDREPWCGSSECKAEIVRALEAFYHLEREIDLDEEARNQALEDDSEKYRS